LNLKLSKDLKGCKQPTSLKYNFRLTLKTPANFDWGFFILWNNIQSSKKYFFLKFAIWSYFYREAIDDKNHVFGINHSKFENLKDINGKAIAQDKSYHIYNTFIDFHSFCNVFADRTTDGNGIQDLRKIGQKIVHAAAFSAPPTNLGKNIAEGSFFKNGEITLEFKGISVVNDTQCSLIGIDSGESSFKMIINLTPDIEIVTIGSSHYKGDIYKNISSNWVQKVAFDEIVVCETIMPMPPNEINSVVERNILILNVSEEQFFD